MPKKKLLFTLVILISLSGTSYAKNNDNDVNALLKSGNAHYQKKEFSLAIVDLRKALKLDPKNKTIILALRNATKEYGLKLITGNNKKEGKDLIIESGKLGFMLTSYEDKVAMVSSFKAVEAFEKKDFSKVIELLETSKLTKPLDDNMTRLLISSYVGSSLKLAESSKFSEAEKNIIKSKQLLDNSKFNDAPDKELRIGIAKIYTSISLSLGEEYMSNKKYAEAEKEFRKALANEPNNISANSYLGYSTFQLNKLDESINFFEKAVSLGSDYPYDYYNLACIYSLKNKPEQAIKYLKKALVLGAEIKEKVLEDKDFDNIKDLKEFKDLLI